jgi:Cd2+/Zn2+-exporting ATPase
MTDKTKQIDACESPECNTCNMQTGDADKRRNKLIYQGAGCALFITGLIIKAPVIIEFFVFLIAYILIGGEILMVAVKNSMKKQFFDEYFLMSIATIGAFALGEFPEGVAVMLFYQIGDYFQGRAVRNSRKSITELMDIRPDYANIMYKKELKKVSPEDVRVGRIIYIKPGDKIPLDGIITAGDSVLDVSALTGETMPRPVKKGDEVVLGSINIKGLLKVKVKKKFSESTVSKILELVQNARNKKADTENLITTFAKYYTPFVVFAAFFVAVLPPLFIKGEMFDIWLHRALVFLVISCPCALVVSIPLSFFGGIGAASKSGILIKGSNYLEGLNKVKTVIFDKTGTLTAGEFKVTRIQSGKSYTDEEILKYAAYAESYSNHPIALSILKEYKEKIDKDLIENYQELSGFGIKARIDKKDVLIGNSKLLIKEKLIFEDIKSTGTIVYIAVNRKFAGFIEISDQLKEDSEEAVKDLKMYGINKTVMLSGDNRNTSKFIGNLLGIDEVYPELLPNDKVDLLEKMMEDKKENEKIAFIGDGINDAPVLARADIGIAMGGIGSDAAIEAADIVLMTDEPSKIIKALSIAKKTKRIVWQNIFFAFGIKLLVMVLGTFGIATMWEAVFADVGVTMIAVFNAMRLIRKK